MTKRARLIIRTRYDLDRRRNDSDQPLVDEMLRDYRDIEYDDVPPDPRKIDTARIAALRERLSSEFSYRWREQDADLELAEALFGGRRSNSGDLAWLKTGFQLKNHLGHSPPRSNSPINWGDADGYKRKYYITIAISTARAYISSLGFAEDLLRRVFPGFGYAMKFGDDGHMLRLERGSETGPWFAIEPPARALVIATLERLERHPDEAAAWRSPA